MFETDVYTANSNLLPFASVCGGATPTPFSIAPYSTYSPFKSQRDSVMTYALDSLQIDFIETESPLTVKGKY